ncbi:hypothetical protein JNW88_15675 [Micromonospora sp. ATA32]|nr:hypothetical protein [Micromonospora sp. ATA32]
MTRQKSFQDPGAVTDGLVTAHKVPGWWAQTVTVGYEQARGLRAPGQSRAGGFSASGSKTVGVPRGAGCSRRFADEALRAPVAAPMSRSACVQRPRRRPSVPTGAGGPTRIAVGFAPKGEAKAQVAVLHEKLADADEAARCKAYWRERLAVLKQVLESEKGVR